MPLASGCAVPLDRRCPKDRTVRHKQSPSPPTPLPLTRERGECASCTGRQKGHPRNPRTRPQPLSHRRGRGASAPPAQDARRATLVIRVRAPNPSPTDAGERRVRHLHRTPEGRPSPQPLSRCGGRGASAPHAQGARRATLTPTPLPLTRERGECASCTGRQKGHPHP